MSLVKDIMTNGYVTNKAYMGITPQTMTAQMAQQYRYDVTEGVFVCSVDPDSAAAKAGLRLGDVITKMDDKTITSYAVSYTHLCGGQKVDDDADFFTHAAIPPKFVPQRAGRRPRRSGCRRRSPRPRRRDRARAERTDSFRFRARCARGTKSRCV